MPQRSPGCARRFDRADAGQAHRPALHPPRRRATIRPNSIDQRPSSPVASPARSARRAAEELAVLAGFARAAPVPLLISADLEGSRMSLAVRHRSAQPARPRRGRRCRSDARDQPHHGRGGAGGRHQLVVHARSSTSTPRSAAPSSPPAASAATSTPSSAMRWRRSRCSRPRHRRDRQALAGRRVRRPRPAPGHHHQSAVSIDDWEETFGRLYRAAIEAGVLSVMAGTSRFPAFVRSLDPDAGVEAFRPASISRVLNDDAAARKARLQRPHRLRCDADGRARRVGRAQDRDPGGHRRRLRRDPLLRHDPEGDVAAIKDALADGRLTQARVDEAVIRVLGLKAALGLHKPDARAREARLAALGTAANRDSARAITRPRADAGQGHAEPAAARSAKTPPRAGLSRPASSMPFLPQPLPLRAARDAAGQKGSR